MTQMVSDLDTVVNPPKVFEEHIQSTLDRDIAEISDNLRTRLDSVERWFKRFAEIRTANESVVKRMGDAPIPDPMRDLGLVRWGAQLSTEGRQSLAKKLQALMSQEAGDREQGCTSLASAILDVTTDERCIIVSSQLWFLSLWEAIAKVIDDYASARPGNLNPQLVVMRTAAVLRRSRHRSLPALQSLIGEITDLADEMTGSARGRFNVGLGYCAFYAAQTAGEKRGSHAKTLQRRWGSLSFDAAVEATTQVQRPSLEWAFAVNHCAYVGTVLGKNPRITGRYLRQLAALQTDPAWHYRFCDTLATHHYLRAKSLWERMSSGPKPSHDMELPSIFRSLAEAERLLRLARPDFGDPEIAQHRTEVSILISEIESVLGRDIPFRE